MTVTGTPLVAAVEMGYGHLRAADALSRALGAPLSLVDRQPFASAGEELVWRTSKLLYELTSRASQVPVAGYPCKRLLDSLTAISPLETAMSAGPDLFSRGLARCIGRGLGAQLAATLAAREASLLTTFFTPALAVDHHGETPVWCVVTDAEVARVWVPREPQRSRIRYLVPSARCHRRLQAYGVPAANLTLTGFPLPPESPRRQRPGGAPPASCCSPRPPRPNRRLSSGACGRVGAGAWPGDS